ncbi:AAA family ATPase [Sinorhizobium meliloti]|nr:AAA family ATPase [Sinorhizobium meliloti]MDX0266019.1 AAA family ATPase [Sinorhizobium meliloti]MDX0353393.1 AAA family ATPase [Sinorhizobium meliloti]
MASTRAKSWALSGSKLNCLAWYAFTNLDLVLGAGKAREIDMIMVTEQRIFLIDIKDWHGKIEEQGGRWLQNGKDKDSSPVQKINGIAREVTIRLTTELKKRPETKGQPTPSVIGLVVLTARPDIGALEGLEREKVLHIDEFIKISKTEAKLREKFGPPYYLSKTLTDPFWKDKLSRFFNARVNSPFKSGRKRFQRFLADEHETFVHPSEMYKEFNAEEEGNKASLGVLRLWDFTKSPDGRFQTQEGRLEIAGREQQVYHWLRDRNGGIERSLVAPRADDPDRGVNYWEVYDRQRRTKRLGDFVTSEVPRLLDNERIELARQLLHAVSGMHEQNSSHLDLGSHSIWLELPTSVRISHLMSARFPEGKSLGPSRYHFLSSSPVPEDLFDMDQGPKKKDVYLLGLAVHRLIFGVAPDGDPAEWKPEVDKDGRLSFLHEWFSSALDLDPTGRFEDAIQALAAFNRLTALKPNAAASLARLDQYRGALKSQRQFFSAYPEDGDMLAESDRLDVWRTTTEHGPAIVKLWKQPAWGDLSKECGSVETFLHRARELQADDLRGLATVREAVWLGDSIGLVQDWVEGRSLQEELALPEQRTQSASQGLALVQSLLRNAQTLHDRAFAHGDLKPSNIIVPDDADPVFIDALDYSPSLDGDITSSEYAPESGTAYERDRFALTKITEEVLARTDLDAELSADVAKAIQLVRKKEPALSTLAPLTESIDRVVHLLTKRETLGETERETISVSLVGSKIGELESDEGYFFVRFRRDKSNRLFFVIRGASEEISFKLDVDGRPVSGRRSEIEQSFIARISKFEFYILEDGLAVTEDRTNDFSAIEALLAESDICERLQGELSGRGPASSEVETAVENGELPPQDDEAEDNLAEETAGELDDEAIPNVDVPALWRALMDAEQELTTEGEATLDSVYDRATNRHAVAVQLDTGDFEFSREDTVGVERLDRKGTWRRIGRLDLDRSKPEYAVIVADAISSFHDVKLVEEGQRLRFVSHFEIQSYKRRSSAVGRVLDGLARAPNLLSVFDPRTRLHPTQVAVNISDADLSLYGFNHDQLAAFRRVVSTRPVGVLQGPPGTGKTRFIAALTHFALTQGLARNVLLSSQSHEAVNTAAEAVLKLFRSTGAQPDLLRVGMNDSQVSETLRPYHTAHVEQGYKDRFSAMFAERMAIAGSSLGLPRELVSDVITLENQVRPVIERLADILDNGDEDTQRINGLIETLKLQLVALEIEIELPSRDGTGLEWRNLLERVALTISRQASTKYDVGQDRVNNLRIVADIGKDFIGSVSRVNRSFDTFLAGTRQIVAGTCVGLGRSSLGLTATPFDLVIVDEAARCTAGELLVPLQAARWAVMVGDQAQLEPLHDVDVVTMVSNRTAVQKSEIKRSDFERVFKSEYGRIAGAKLQTQYRMLPPIGQIVSETFYSDLKLQAGRSKPEIDPELLPPDLDRPLTWVSTDGLGVHAFEKSVANSKPNRTEADAIVAMIEDWVSHEPFREWLTTQTSHPIGVGIICMYAAQRNLIETRLRQSQASQFLDRHIKVGTVDSYQGKENPIVVVSLVRNNMDGRDNAAGKKTIRDGFLNIPNRINVAASRAMDRLVFVGAYRNWKPESSVGRLAESFANQVKAGEAVVMEAEKVMEPSRRTPEGQSQASGKKSNDSVRSQQ